MVFKKLVSLFYNFIGLRGRRPIKETSSSSCHEVIESGFIEKRWADDSPAGWGGVGGEGVEVEVCCVCLSRLKEGEDTRILPCMHEFHRVCVDRWFNVCRKTCPVCRFSMGNDEDRFQKREELTEEMVIWFSSFHVAGF